MGGLWLAVFSLVAASCGNMSDFNAHYTAIKLQKNVFPVLLLFVIIPRLF